MNKSHVQMEFDARLEEYRTLKAEIVSNLSSGRNITNLCLTFSGILIASAPYFITNKFNIIFLIAPILFFVLAWAQLRYVFLVLDMGRYLHETAIPDLRNTIKLASPKGKSNLETLMKWDTPGKNPIKLRKNIFLQFLFLPIAGANYGIPLIASVLSVATFFSISGNMYNYPAIYYVLITVDVIGLFYSVYWGFQAELRR